ncbi:MAG: AI-2E family transporter [archaeon]
MTLKKHSKYFLLALFILLLVGAIFIVKPYIGAILTALVLGYIFFPVYRKINSWIKRPTISALIMTGILLILIFVPAFFFVNMLVNEVGDRYATFEESDLSTFLNEKMGIELTEANEERILDIAHQGTEYLFKEASSFVFSLPKKLINFIIMLFVFFFVFKDGEKVVNEFKKSLPIEDSHKTRVFNKIETTVNSLVYGEIAISIIEGVIATLGFWLLGVPAPALFGSIIAIAALLPAIGPLVVWGPLALYMYLIGETGLAIGVGLFGFLVLTLALDMIVKPKVLGYKGHIHPIIILLGVLGGLSVFGLTGLILGPVILVLLMLLIEIYVQEGIK